MKLSTAIRIGSMTTKQIRGAFTDGGNGRCALGAAIDATGEAVLFGADGFEQLDRLFPMLADNNTALNIALMNDTGKYTREQIAAYVEGLENGDDGYLATGITESKPLELIAREGK